MHTPLDLYSLTCIVALWLLEKFVGHCHMHSTNHISRSIYRTVVHLLHHHHHLESYSYFRFSSPISILHTAISLAVCHPNSCEARAFKCVNQMKNYNVQFPIVTRNPEITVQFAVSPYANLTQLP